MVSLLCGCQLYSTSRNQRITLFRSRSCGVNLNFTTAAKLVSTLNWHGKYARNWHGRYHDDVIKWKHFPRYWPFVRGIHRPTVNSPHKGQWCGALMFSLICAWIYGWVNNREAGDLRCHRAHYDVTEIYWARSVDNQSIKSAASSSCADHGSCMQGIGYLFKSRLIYMKPIVCRLNELTKTILCPSWVTFNQAFSREDSFLSVASPNYRFYNLFSYSTLQPSC